jgi:hypothetical protein
MFIGVRHNDHLVRSREMIVQMLTKVKPLSPNHRFAIALHSLGRLVETGLPICLPEKKALTLAAGFSGTVSPVRFEG